MNGYKTAKRSFSAAALLTGAAVGALVCALLLAICSAVFVKLGSVPTSAAQTITTAVGAAGAFAAGWSALKLYGSRGLVMGASAGLLLFLSTLIAGIIAKETPDTAAAAVKLIVFVIAGAVGGVVRVNKREKIKNVR